MPYNQNFSMQDKVAIGAISTFILVIAVLRYSGIPDQYAVFYDFFQNSEHYVNDIFMKNTFFFEGSNFFAINKFLGLDRSENVTFALYLTMTALAFYFTYLIISRHFGLTGPLEVFVVLLFVSIVDRYFPNGGWGGIIPMAPGIPATYAKVLRLIAIYCLLENRIWLSSIILTLTISIHISADFLLFPILFFFVVFNKNTSNKNLAALVIPVIFLVFKQLTTSLKIPSGQDPQEYERVMYLAGPDGDFLNHPTMVIVLFAVSFFVFAAILRRFRNNSSASPNLHPLLMAIYISSLLTVLTYTFYIYYGYKLFFYPPIVLLFPLRAMTFYSLFFYLSALVLILQSRSLTNIEKVSMALGLVMVHGESLGGVLYPAIILIGGFSVSRFSGDQLSWLKQEKALIPLSLVLLIALASARVATGTVYHTSFDSLAWQHMDRWRINLKIHDEAVWNAYEKVRNTEKDFTMLPLYRTRNGKLRSSAFLNIFAKKSHFVAAGHFSFFDAKLWEETKVRQKAYDDIFSSIETKRSLSESARDVLRSRNVTIVVPESDAINLTGWAENTTIGSFSMLRFSEQP